MTHEVTLGRRVIRSTARVIVIVAMSMLIGAGYVRLRFPKLRWLPDPNSIIKNVVVQNEAYITAKETFALVQAGRDGSQAVALIDARPHDKFLEGHIAAATILNIPGDERYDYDTSNLELIRGFKIVVYCTSKTCDLAGLVYDMLVHEMQFDDVSHYHDGWEGWLETGYATEPGPQKFMGAPLPGANAEPSAGAEDSDEP